MRRSDSIAIPPSPVRSHSVHFPEYVRVRSRDITKEGHGRPFPLTSWRRFLLVVIFASESLESYRAGSVGTDRLMINYLEQAGYALPPTKFKPCLPSNSHGTQGGAHTRTQTTTESLRSSQTALPAHIPSGRAKESSATSAT